MLLINSIPGCSLSGKPNINDVGIEHLEQKYNEKCEYSQAYGEFGSNKHQLLITCEGMPNQNILVQIENYNKPNKIFSDNYLAIKYHSETINLFHRIATSIYDQANIHYEVTKQPQSSDLPANATFEEFFTDPNLFISFLIEVKASEFTSREQAEKVIDSIYSASNPDARILIIMVFVEDNKYGTLDEDAIRTDVVHRNIVHGVRASSGQKIEWLR